MADTVTFKDPVAVPHRYRNRFLRDSASAVSRSSSSQTDGGNSNVDLSAYLRKATFDDLFEKELQDDGTYAIKAKYSLYSVGGLTAHGYGNDSESGGSVVTWQQIITSGTCIAQITIDGEPINVYAPTGGGSGTVNSWSDISDRPTWLDSYLGSKIPAVSLFDNDAGYLTEHQSLSEYLKISVAADTYQTIISDLSTIRSNAADGETAYGWGNHANAGYMKTDTFNGKTISLWGNTVSLNGGSATGSMDIQGSIAVSGGATIGNQSGVRELISDGAVMLYQATPYIDFHYGLGSSYNVRLINDADNVLHLDGTNPALRIGNAYLHYDSTNNCLYVDNGSDGVVNFVATGGINAYGLGTDKAEFDTLKVGTITDCPLLEDGLYVGAKTNSRQITDVYVSNNKVYIEFGGSTVYELTPTSID